jgi:phage head maturation protease
MSATMVETRVEYRSGEGQQVAEVNFPKRLVTVVAMPYEQPTEIYEHGKVFTEIVSRTAFDGAEKRTNKLPRVNRGHDPDRLAGKIVALHPSRSEGLVAEVRMFTTALGEETLVLCDEGGLDASAGFMLLRRDNGRGPVYEDAEVWDNGRTLRRLNRLHLDHLAFVASPAYKDAVVLDVRDASVRPQEPLSREETPNRDRIAMKALWAQHADMNRRYLRP